MERGGERRKEGGEVRGGRKVGGKLDRGVGREEETGGKRVEK